MTKKNVSNNTFPKTITYQDVENKILNIRNMSVILDSDIARLYQIETKKLNQAVSRNKDKFPPGYIIELTPEEKNIAINTPSKPLLFNEIAEPVTKCDRFKNLKHSSAPLKAFTEKGLYMLATILKSPIATQTSLLIIDIFTKTRELERAIQQTQTLPENSIEKKAVIEKTGELINELITPTKNLTTTDTETSVEMNFAVFKIKRTVKKSR